MRTRFAGTIILLFLQPVCCLATGWTDYEIDLGDGYSLVRGNSTDIFITRGDYVVFPESHGQDIGIIVRYAITDRYIFLENVGTKRRETSGGNWFLEPDPSRRFFYILAKRSNEIFGPFSHTELERQLTAIGVSSLSWKERRNPHPWVPMLCLVLMVGKVNPQFIVVPLILIAVTVFLFLMLLCRGRR